MILRNQAKVVALLVMLLALPIALSAQSWGYDNNRFAISADGNNVDDPLDKWLRADEDDWGATPATMAIIAKLGLGDKLVHYSYNNFVEGKPGPADENMMNIGVQGGLKRFPLNKKVFFDCTKKFDKAKKSLKAEIAKSTADDPLYFMHMGPSEFFYQCVDEVIQEGGMESLAHIYVVSHSGYNDNHIRRPYHHTMDQAIELSEGRINYKRIKDQNGSSDPNALLNSLEDFSVWYWMRDSKDPNIQWIYERMLPNAKGHADISDAGITYYLLVGDEDGSPSKLRDFFGDSIL
ncbi:MAG: hypothetical protein R3Y39_05480 [Rikenellaceae bacterium]